MTVHQQIPHVVGRDRTYAVVLAPANRPAYDSTELVAGVATGVAAVRDAAMHLDALPEPAFQRAATGLRTAIDGGGALSDALQALIEHIEPALCDYEEDSGAVQDRVQAALDALRASARAFQNAKHILLAENAIESFRSGQRS